MLIQQCDLTDPHTLTACLDVGYDVLITDPPYSAVVHEKAVSCHSNGDGATKRDLGFAPLSEQLRANIARLADRAKRWSVIFSDIEGSHLWRETVGAEHIRTLPWVRWTQPQLSGDRPPSGCELISLWHAPGRKRWSGPGSLTAFDERALRGADKYSCEKPLDLMLSLVSYFSDAGELVLDPCCGSGTTGLACAILGREALLLDSSPDAIGRALMRTGAPLTPRDRERCRRWVEYQEGWLGGAEPDSASGRARYARARSDTDRARAAL
jgi:site-specific DNA-methyltransferase (adenine-specific)